MPRPMISLLTTLLALTPAELAATSRITAAEISGHIRFLSDDLLEGRKPGARGDEVAIKYLAAQLETMGFKPGGDNGTFIQPVPLIELKVDAPREVTFRAGDKALALRANIGLEEDLAINPNTHAAEARLQDPPVVFARYGIVAPEYSWENNKDLAVLGNVVALLNVNPPF